MANRYSQVFAIANKKGLAKESVSQLVQGLFGKPSLKDLSDNEVRDLIITLNSEKEFKSNADVMRKKIISLLATMESYYSQKTKYEFVAHNVGKPQMGGTTGIYAFILSVGYLKKPFNEYTVQELPKLVTQITQLRKHVWDAQATKAVNELKEVLA